MRGRKPKPTAQRRLEGNPGKRPLNAREPQFPAADEAFDALPVELTGDQRATQEWQRLAPLLRQARQITDADRGSLIALCQQWSRYQDAIEKAQVHGMVVKIKGGYPIINPYLSIGNKALAACTKLWAELGLTPSSRSRVTLAAEPETDAFDQYLTKAPLRIVK